MTRETRIGLLVGLLFIVLFGLVLSELTGKQTKALSPTSLTKHDSPGGNRPIIDDPSPLVARRGELAAEKRETIAVAPAPAGGPPGVVDVTMLPPGPDATRGLVESGLRRELIGPTPMPAGDPIVAIGPTGPAGPPGQKYVTQPSDSLIKIARKFYGEANWREYKRIYEANKGVLTSEAAVPVGREILIPPLPGPARVAGASGSPGAPPAAPSPSPGAAPPAPAPEPVPRIREMTVEEMGRHFAAAPSPAPAAPRVHVIQRGDNLVKIARQYLKDDSRAAVLRIYNANKDKLANPDVLPVGTELTIPS